MQQDGPHLSKLKQIFKRAVQEIMTEEETVQSLLASPSFRDSFFSESTIHQTPEEVGKMFQEIRTRFTEVFKTKMRQTNLDYLLNSLDKDIREGRVSYRDIRDEEYIWEILESSVVDRKEELVRQVEAETEEAERKIGELQREKGELEANLRLLEYENEEGEREYQGLIREIEAVLKE